MRPDSCHVHVTISGMVCISCKTVRGVGELVLRDNDSGEVIGCSDCAAERLLK